MLFLALFFNKEGSVLLQRRSKYKRLWPNKWDVTVGGHVRAGELGRQALIRECKEELGLEVADDDIKFLLSSVSKYSKDGYVSNHIDEFYLILKDVNVDSLILQESEVSEVRYFSKEELLASINNKDMTQKTVSWSFVKRFIETGFFDDFLKSVEYE